MRAAPAGTGKETGAAVESSALIQRLKRRHTEPPGVIDVRWPQTHYARTAGWIAQRLPLLQQLAVRYGGGDEGQTGSDLVYRTAEAFPPELLSASTRGKAFPPAAGVSSTVSTVPPATLRVSRRPSSIDGGRYDPDSITAATPASSTEMGMETAVLLQRLERRRTEPLGMVDVHWPQTHYARTAGWIAQRLPLLQQSAVRYGGGDEGQTGSGLVYRTAEAFSPKLLSTSTRGKTFLPAAGVSSTVSTVPPATLRVSRRPPSLAAKPAPAAVPVLSSTPEGGRPVGREPQSRETVTTIPQPSLQTPNRVIARQVAGTPVQGTPQPETGASPVQGDSPSLGHKAVLAPAGAGDTTPVGNSSMVPADWQRSPGEPSTETTVRPELRRVKAVPLAASQPATQLLLRVSSGVPVALENPPASSGREVLPPQPAAALQPRITPTLTLLPHQGGGNEPAVQLQRLSDDAQTSALSASAVAVGAVDSHSPPVVMEIRNNSTFGQESGMIWRQSSNVLMAGEASGAGMGGSARAMLPLTLKSAGNSALPVARQTTTHATIPPSSPADTQSLPPLSASLPSPVGMDWEQLIEQVGRHILRQLTIARERRGLKGWN
jgi:hypothetical protein